MLTIRLQRSGKRNKPEFRIVLAQKTSAVNKKFLEVLGHYNPRTKDFVIKSEDRLKYWIAQHVTLSPTINNLFVSKNLISSPKVKAFNTPKKKAEDEAPAAPAATAAESTAPAEPAATEAEAPTAQADDASTAAEPAQPAEAPEAPAEQPAPETPAEAPPETTEPAEVQNPQ